MVSKYLCSISPAVKTARTDVCTVHSDMAVVTIKYGNASVPDDKELLSQTPSEFFSAAKGPSHSPATGGFIPA